MLKKVNNDIIVKNYDIKKRVVYKKNILSIEINHSFFLKKNDNITYICKNCNKEINELFLYKEKFLTNQFICNKCNKKQNNLKKYGVENISQLNWVKEKKKNTCLNKYGVECSLQSKEIILKKQENNLKKYGNKNYTNRDKANETCLKKYGNKNYTNRDKANKTLYKKYNIINAYQIKKVKADMKIKTLVNAYDKFIKLDNVKPLFTIEEYLEKSKKYDKFIWKCTKCKTEFQGYYENGIEPKCPTCYPKMSGFSTKEKKIESWCSSLGLDVIENDRELIFPYEIDIYIPSKKLAIEYNGIYWHSTKFINDKWYHQRKVELAYRRGVRLLHIWEHEDEEDIKQIIQYYLNNMDDFIEVEKPKLYNINDNLIWI